MFESCPLRSRAEFPFLRPEYTPLCSGRRSAPCAGGSGSYVRRRSLRARSRRSRASAKRKDPRTLGAAGSAGGRARGSLCSDALIPLSAQGPYHSLHALCFHIWCARARGSALTLHSPAGGAHTLFPSRNPCAPSPAPQRESRTPSASLHPRQSSPLRRRALPQPPYCSSASFPCGAFHRGSSPPTAPHPPLRPRTSCPTPNCAPQLLLLDELKQECSTPFEADNVEHQVCAQSRPAQRSAWPLRHSCAMRKRLALQRHLLSAVHRGVHVTPQRWRRLQRLQSLPCSNSFLKPVSSACSARLRSSFSTKCGGWSALTLSFLA